MAEAWNNCRWRSVCLYAGGGSVFIRVDSSDLPWGGTVSWRDTVNLKSGECAWWMESCVQHYTHRRAPCWRSVVFISLSSDCVGLSCSEGVKTHFKQSSVKWTKEARRKIPEWEGRKGSISNFSVHPLQPLHDPVGNWRGEKFIFTIEHLLSISKVERLLPSAAPPTDTRVFSTLMHMLRKLITLRECQ